MSNAMSGLEDLRYFLTDGAEITVAHPGERGSITIGPITTRHIMAALDEVLGEERGSVSPKRMTLTEALAHVAAGPVMRASTGPLDELKKALEHGATALASVEDREFVIEFGKPLGGGLIEFRLRHTEDEVRRRLGLSPKSPKDSGERILLRVFCHPFGKRKISERGHRPIEPMNLEPPEGGEPPKEATTKIEE